MPLLQLCILLAFFGSSLVILHDKTGQAIGRQFPSKDLVISRIPLSTAIAAPLSGTSQLVPGHSRPLGQTRQVLLYPREKE